METTSVRCNSCGAALDVSAQTRFVTCRFCQSQLEVKRTETSSFTEVIQALVENTSNMESRLTVIEIQNDLERLEKEWEVRSESYCTTGQNGVKTRPEKTSPVFLYFFIGVMVIFAISIAVTINSGAGIFTAVVGSFAAVILASVISNINYNAENLDKVEAWYLGEREKLLNRLEQARLGQI